MIDIIGLREDKRPQSSTIVHALLDRLEAAEKELAELRSSMKFRTSLIGRTEAERDDAKAAAENIALKLDYLRSKLETAKNAKNDWLRANAPGGWIDNLRIENEALRAKIERMERQGPVEWQTRTRPAWNDGTWGPWRKCSEEYAEDIKKTPLLHDWLYEARALYALPGAQPEPSEQDASVRKAWARFSHELHRSPDAPYPGMADAFEQHFSQSFIDREWRAEAATWAAAWKAAKRHGVPPAPSINEGVRKVTLGFRWESEAQHHIPTIEIEFDPVSPDSPNDAKGWQDRDRIASMLSPEAKP